MVKSRLFVSLVLLVFLAPGLGLAQSKGDAKAGKLKYDANCAGCHGATGKGDGPAAAALNLNPKPGDMSDGKAMKALTDKYLFDIIKDGGASQKKSPIMPGSGKKFSDQEVWDIVAYIRSLAK